MAGSLTAGTEVLIESIAAGGEGVGRLPDGRAVFVHRTAPDERVMVDALVEHRRWARGRLARIVEPSPDRREAPCPLYERCGGCTLEHLHYPAQLAAKLRIVSDALSRIGKLEVEPSGIVPSPEEFRYRNRVTFTLRRLASGRVVAGFHELDNPGRILDIDGRCLLPEEPLAVAWEELRAGWGSGAAKLPAGKQLRLTLRATADGAVSLVIDGGRGPGRPAELLEAVPSLAAVWHRRNRSAELVAGAAVVRDRWGDDEVEVSGDAFLQVNRAAAALLEQHVLELAGEVRGVGVIDAYCGVGLRGSRLARAGAEVVGIELSSAAVAEARRAAPDGIRFIEGRVEANLPAELPAELVIVNPPRAGLAAETCDALLAEPPERVIYVSCDPATLARDLRRLAGGFAAESVRCFDLFPQTAHVETVVSLTRTRTECATT
ncbi:23S rRNA (uracil(1939)-C(5))-methyltransferase RlmD [soil metagenome]